MTVSSSACKYYGAVCLLLLLLATTAKARSTDKLQECRAAIKSQKYQVAISACQSAAESMEDDDDDKAEAFILAGDAFTATGKTLQAMRAYKEAVEVDEGNQLGLAGLAESASKLGDFGQAAAAGKLLRGKDKKKATLVKCKYSRLLELKGQKLLDGKRYKLAKLIYADLVSKSPNASRFLSALANCNIYLHEYQVAIELLKREAALAGDSSNSYFTMGKVYLVQGNLEAAKKFINGAVRDNPDLRPAMALRSKIKQVEALIEEANTKMLIIQSIQTLEDLQSELAENPVKETEKYYDPRFPNLLKQAFAAPLNTALCLKKGRRKDANAVAICRSALASNPKGADKKALLMALVEALMASDIEEAVREMRPLQEQHGRDQDVQKLAKRVNEAHKKSKVKDYYEVLGLDKSASQKDIKKAYKRLSRKWHPDKHSANPGPAEQKMRDINKAHELLGNPETRRKYDQLGYDPDDPEAQQAAQHGGFHGGGFHDFGGFGGDPFEFVFNDGQGRQYRQHTGHGHGQQKKQQQQQQWRWEDL